MSTPTAINAASVYRTSFGQLRIHFDDRVLRPRNWTVAQATWAAELMHASGSARMLELCTGAGQIGLLALALGPESTRLVAVDASPVACGFARHNSEVAGLSERVEVREGPMDQVLDDDERFDIVIADPPWVERGLVTQFPDDPLVAIDGGPDGLDVAWACLELAERHLEAGGSLLLQLGSPSQVDRVDAQLRTRGASLAQVEARHFGSCGSLVHYRRI